MLLPQSPIPTVVTVVDGVVTAGFVVVKRQQQEEDQ